MVAAFLKLNKQDAVGVIRSRIWRRTIAYQRNEFK